MTLDRIKWSLLNLAKSAMRPKQRIVIFDSPDGTGKTNIAQGLSRQLGIPYFRMGSQHDNWRKGRFKDALEFDQTYLIEFLKQTEMSVIIDRAYPAEWVYSSVYRRETNWSLIGEIDEEFAQLGANIVIPLRRDYTHSRPDEVVKNDMLPHLHQKYLEFREFTKCNTLTIYVDSFGDNLDLELEALVPDLDWCYDPKMARNITLDGFWGVETGDRDDHGTDWFSDLREPVRNVQFKRNVG